MAEREVLLVEDRLVGVKSWQRVDERAPHKPLLILLALAKIQRGEPNYFPFSEVEPALTELLAEFGPRRRASHPENPFWRLQNDLVWTVVPNAPIRSELTASGDATKSSLRRHAAVGSFEPEIYAALASNKGLVNEIAAKILDNAFAPTMHETILDAIGFPWVVAKRTRDPAFREEIVRIYEHRCAVCGWDGRLGSSNVGLEAAHIKWHAAGGPDSSDNGIAMCSLHHTLFDRGAISLDEDNKVLVSKDLHGQGSLAVMIIELAGSSLRAPQRGEPLPSPRYTSWHRKEVFWSPARQSSQMA